MFQEMGNNPGMCAGLSRMKRCGIACQTHRSLLSFCPFCWVFTVFLGTPFDPGTKFCLTAPFGFHQLVMCRNGDVDRRNVTCRPVSIRTIPKGIAKYQREKKHTQNGCVFVEARHPSQAAFILKRRNEGPLNMGWSHVFRP